MFSRRNLTDLLVGKIITATEFPVGDAEVPEPPYGWSGQPGQPGSTFTPYSILTPMTASGASGPISDTHADWKLPYSVASYGTSRKQCEWICDKARSSFYTLKKTTFNGVDGTYTIQQVRTDNIGGIVRNETVEPHVFGETDIYTVWVTKS